MKSPEDSTPFLYFSFLLHSRTRASSPYNEGQNDCAKFELPPSSFLIANIGSTSSRLASLSETPGKLTIYTLHDARHCIRDKRAIPRGRRARVEYKVSSGMTRRHEERRDRARKRARSSDASFGVTIWPLV